MPTDVHHGLVPGQITAVRCLPGERCPRGCIRTTDGDICELWPCDAQAALVSGPRPSNSPGHAHITNQIGNIKSTTSTFISISKPSGRSWPAPGVRGIQHAADQAGAV